jgi:hypothetical protein
LFPFGGELKSLFVLFFIANSSDVYRQLRPSQQQKQLSACHSAGVSFVLPAVKQQREVK